MFILKSTHEKALAQDRKIAADIIRKRDAKLSQAAAKIQQLMNENAQLRSDNEVFRRLIETYPSDPSAATQAAAVLSSEVDELTKALGRIDDSIELTRNASPIRKHDKLLRTRELVRLNKLRDELQDRIRTASVTTQTVPQISA